MAAACGFAAAGAGAAVGGGVGGGISSNEYKYSKMNGATNDRIITKSSEYVNIYTNITT